MSRYILIHRLRGPAFLLLVGVNALLAQRGILGWGQSWPFYLILAGLLMLAERAALASEDYLPFPGVPGCGAGQGAGEGVNPGTNPGTIAGAPSPSAGQGAANPASEVSGAIVPPQWQEFDDKKGGQS